MSAAKRFPFDRSGSRQRDDSVSFLFFLLRDGAGVDREDVADTGVVVVESAAESSVEEEEEESVATEEEEEEEVVEEEEADKTAKSCLSFSRAGGNCAGVIVLGGRPFILLR